MSEETNQINFIKKKAIRVIIFAVSFAIGAGIILGAGYYKKTLKNESCTFAVALPLKTVNLNAETTYYDIENQGFIKRLIQPGRISVGTGHSGGITNTGKEPLWLEVSVEGFGKNTEISSMDKSFDKSNHRFKSPLEPSNSFAMDVALDIPRSDINKNYRVQDGKIILRDYKKKELLAKIPVSVINSEVKHPDNVTVNLSSKDKWRK